MLIGVNLRATMTIDKLAQAPFLFSGGVLW
jgi:hypothetical protein